MIQMHPNFTFVVAPEKVDPPKPVPVQQSEPAEERCPAAQCTPKRNPITYYEGGGSPRAMGPDGYYTLGYLAK